MESEKREKKSENRKMKTPVHDGFPQNYYVQKTYLTLSTQYIHDGENESKDITGNYANDDH